MPPVGGGKHGGYPSVYTYVLVNEKFWLRAVGDERYHSMFSDNCDAMHSAWRNAGGLASTTRFTVVVCFER